MRTYSCKAEIRVRHNDLEEVERLAQLLLDDGLRGLGSSGEDRFIIFADLESVEELPGLGAAAVDGIGQSSPGA